MSADAAGTCVAEFRKYSDTVAVSSAVSHLFDTHPQLGQFIGVEHALVGSNPSGILKPDITVVYGAGSCGLLFDLKYSLPTNVNSVSDELVSLEKYGGVQGGWGVPGPVKTVDFVLVCNVEDVHRAAQAAEGLFKESGKHFFDPTHFAIWHWTISAPREDERKEVMRLQHAYGATRNAELQHLITVPGGVAIPEEVLTTLRFTNAFVREKPPVQYTISLLIQNVFSLLPPLHRPGRRIYNIDLDLIYEKANSLFPPWWENDVETVQVKRGWIKEALNEMARLKLIELTTEAEVYSIPIPTVVSGRPLPWVICRKMVALGRKTRSRKVRVQSLTKTKSRPSGDKSIVDYLYRK